MKRIAAVIAGVLCLTAAVFAQASVPSETALTSAMADVNSKLGTNYVYNGGQLTYEFTEQRVNGDNLGCPNVAATNQDPRVVTITRFDINFDGVFEWEHRFAYEADGSLRAIVCQAPDLSQVSTATVPAATPSPETPQDTPQATLDGTSSPAPIFGRDGPRIFPGQVCGGLPTRLVNGGTGRVAPGGAPNNLRQTGDLTSLRLGQLEPGSVFTVMDGPFCNGDIAWYLVGTGAQPLGWTAEGVDGDYFLEPVVTNAERIVPSNVARLAPFGGVFGPNAGAFSANWPGGLVLSTDESLRVVGPTDGFTSLELLQWDVGREVPTPAEWVFADNTGRIWMANVDDNNMLMLTLDNDQTGVGITRPTSGALPVLAIDNESNFAAVLTEDANTVALYQLGRNGGQTAVLFTLAANGPVVDIAFGVDGMYLYVLTANQLSMYRFEMGEGWSAQPRQVFDLDIAARWVTVAEGGDQVAVAGTNAQGNGAIRVFSNINTEEVGDEVSVNYDAPSAVTLARPSFNSDGSLVAAYASDGTVVLFDTATGQPSTLPVTATPGTAGSAAFSRDGLLLWVSMGAGGVQAYGVPLAG